MLSIFGTPLSHFFFRMTRAAPLLVSFPWNSSSGSLLCMCPVAEEGQQGCSSSRISSLRMVTKAAPLHMFCRWGGSLEPFLFMCPIPETVHQDNSFSCVLLLFLLHFLSMIRIIGVAPLHVSLCLRNITRATPLLASCPWEGSPESLLFLCPLP